MLRRPLAVLAAVASSTLALAGPAAAAGADTTPPSTPAGVVVSDLTESSLTLSWTPSTDDVGVDTYLVRWNVTDVVYGRQTNRTSMTITGLARSNTYWFWVYARDAAGNQSAGSEALRITMPPGDTTPPSTPGSFVADAVTDTTATLGWAPSRDNVGVGAYEIFRITGDARSLAATVPGHPGGLVSWRLYGLSPATTYTFTIRARDDAGNVSGFSEPLTLTTPDSTAPCTVTYRIVSQWPGHFQASVTVRAAAGSPVNGWTVRWAFADGQRVSAMWQTGPYGQSGAAVTAADDGWNASIAGGQSREFGFLASWGTINSVPAAFTLNGRTCASG